MPGRYYHYTKQAELTVRIERVQKYNVTAGEIGWFPCDPYAEHGNYRAPIGGGGGGESAYERIKPQKETELGVAQTFFDP